MKRLANCEWPVNIQDKFWHDAASPKSPRRRVAKFWVTTARGTHPFPSRTRKLSLSAPMVLHARVCGRVGSCPVSNKSPRAIAGFFVLHSSMCRPEELVALLARHNIRYCVIGGQGVNAYAEPLISLESRPRHRRGSDRHRCTSGKGTVPCRGVPTA